MSQANEGADMMSKFRLLKAARTILFFGLVFGWSLTAQADQRDVLFAQGNAAFQSGNFAAAESEYRKLIQSGEVSEDVFFNLGNAIYRQNRPGEAALWFQRARVFDPRMTEANQNLTFLQKTHGYLEIERKPLDRALYKDVKVGHPIPVDLYEVFVEIMAYVYQVSGKKLPS